MKKVIAFLMLALLCAASLTALDMSAGGSVGLNVQPTNTKAEFMGQSMEETYTSTFMTLTGFFDATWLVAQTGVQLFLAGDDEADPNDDTQIIWLSASLFAKYPIQVGAFTLAPMAGFEINKMLSYSVSGTSMDVSDVPLNFAIAIKAGLAADFSLGSQLYLRSTALFGYRFLTDDEKLVISLMEAGGTTYSITPFHLDVTVGIGFKF